MLYVALLWPLHVRSPYLESWQHSAGAAIALPVKHTCMWVFCWNQHHTYTWLILYTPAVPLVGMAGHSYVSHRQPVNVGLQYLDPYCCWEMQVLCSRKLSSVKTFAVSVPSMKFFCDFLGRLCVRAWISWQSVKVFSTKSYISSSLWKFSPVKVSGHKVQSEGQT